MNVYGAEAWGWRRGPRQGTEVNETLDFIVKEIEEINSRRRPGEGAGKGIAGDGTIQRPPWQDEVLAMCGAVDVDSLRMHASLYV